MFQKCFVNCCVYNFEMKHKCTGVCKKAISHLRNSTLFRLVDEFTSNIDLSGSENLKKYYNDFFMYISEKYYITCETGLLFIERMIIDSLMSKYNFYQPSTLMKEKMKLYHFVKPAHLRIDHCKKLSKIIGEIAKIGYVELPSAKTYYLMQGGVSKIYEYNKDIEYDDLLSILVYAIIKTGQTSFTNHLTLMKYFRRGYGKKCIEKCCHGFNTNVECECMISADYNGEDEYYIVTCAAACDFIEKMEYSDLNIKDVEEFLEGMKL